MGTPVAKTSAGYIPSPKNHELILFSNFQATVSILGQESILFINTELILII